MGALADLWKSERGLIAVLLIIGATVLAALGQMTIDQWRDYTLWIFGLYAGAKTITGTVDAIANAKTTPATDPAPASTPLAPALTAAATEPPKAA